ncbi:MAG TPA: M1 family metallopeptidase, partial [Nitrospiraceae bacterium]|nr:M1 family metallopeptidase [Nitrospiraceae bacterium]
WLNEAFATFMEMLAVDAWKPEWQRWTTFGVSRAAAMAVDGLHSTRPIEFPVLAPKDAEAMFDVLTYEKGASVLRMLEQYIGPEVFQQGVRDYLKTHAYGNADTGDLWVALGHAAKQPVPTVMNGWVFKPGYPMLAARLDQGQLVVAQQRFTYLSQSSNGTPTDHQQRWEIPIRIRIVSKGTTETRRVLLTDSETRIDLPNEFDSVLLNEGGHGFYRVRYTPDLLQRLVLHLPGPLEPIDRFNVLSDAWAATIAGYMPLADYLDLTAHFRGERDKNVWAILLDSFHTLNRIILPADRPQLEALVRDRVRPAVEVLGWTPAAIESELTKQLRADLIRAMGTMGNDPQIQARAGDLYAKHVRDGHGDQAALDPNLVPPIIAILAFTGDRQRYDEFFKKFHSASTPQEERRYLYSLAAFRPAPLIEETLTRTINGDIRTQDAPFMVSALLGSIYGRERAWEFVKENWDTMDRLFPKSGLRRMCGGITGLVTPELERDVHKFFEERKIDLGGKTLEQYLEQLHIGVTLREREKGTLKKYLDDFERSSTVLSLGT